MDDVICPCCKTLMIFGTLTQEDNSIYQTGIELPIEIIHTINYEFQCIKCGHKEFVSREIKYYPEK